MGKGMRIPRFFDKYRECKKCGGFVITLENHVINRNKQAIMIRCPECLSVMKYRDIIPGDEYMTQYWM